MVTRPRDDGGRNLRLRPGLRVRTGPGWTLVLSEESTLKYTHPIHVRLLNRLAAGALEEAEAARELGTEFAADMVAAGIEALCEQGIAERAGEAPGDEAAAAFWNSVGRTPGALEVEVLELGARLPFDAAALASRQPGGERLTVICTDDYLRPEVEERCARTGATLLARPAGRTLWIGPLVGVPGSICYGCLAFYLRLHRWRQAGIEGFPAMPAVAALPSSRAMAGVLVASAIERFAAGDDVSDLSGGITMVDPWKWEVERAPFRSRADCAACAGRRAPGLDRTVAILGHAVSGIVEAVRTEQVPATGLHCALGLVLMPEEVRADRMAPLSASGHGRSRQAAVRALTLEAAERYSTLFDGTERLLLGTPAELARFPVECLAGFSEAQYRGEAREFAPLAPADEILWAPARAVAGGSEVAVPAGHVYLDYLFEGEPRYAAADTNGCAAGESVEAAVRSGLLELMERDALAVWWYNRIERPAIGLDDGELAGRDEALAALACEERDLVLFDLTHDLGMPVVAATSALRDGRSVYLGAAADPCMRTAARRAIEEMLQFWTWDRVQRRAPESRRQWLREGTREQFPFLAARQIAPLTTTTAERDPAAALARRGLDAYYIDLTRAAVGIPVVRTIVPGLRHYGRRFAPGRLYDVPVQLGWRRAATAEADLNPYSCPL